MTGRVLVTGSTGSVGSAVVKHLVALGEPTVAAVRDGDTAQPVQGSEPRTFDFADPNTWPAAFDGVDRLFLMRPPPIADVQRYLFPVIDEALARGVEHIIFLSLQGVQFNRATPHHAVEKYLRTTVAPYTFLRPNFFMQNLSTTYRDDIRDRREIAVPAAKARTAFIDTDDIGRVAAQIFANPEGHLRKAHTLSGEESLNYYDVARILSGVLDYPVVYTRPSVDEYVARLEARHAPAEYIEVQKMIYRVVRMNVSAFPNRVVRTITGTPATTFAEFAEREKGVFSGALGR